MDIVKFAKENYGDFVKRANPAMNKMTALQTLLSGKELSKEEVPLIKEFKTVQEFLNQNSLNISLSESSLSIDIKSLIEYVIKPHLSARSFIILK